jgi:DNA repair protein RadC
MKERFIGTNSIREWSSDDQPREKLLLKGSSALSDAELVAILLGTGTKELNAVDLARELLNLTSGDLYDFGKQNLESLCRIKGIGTSKALTLIAAFELGRRREQKDFKKPKKIESSFIACQLVKPYFQESQVEKFYVILLNAKNAVISIEQIAIGGVSMCTVDARVVFNTALSKLASNIILCHNHPSGNPSPSESDRQMTKKLVDGAKLLSMNIIDHLIVTETSFFSFADNCLI